MVEALHRQGIQTPRQPISPRRSVSGHPSPDEIKALCVLFTAMPRLDRRGRIDLLAEFPADTLTAHATGRAFSRPLCVSCPQPRRPPSLRSVRRPSTWLRSWLRAPAARRLSRGPVSGPLPYVPAPSLQPWWAPTVGRSNMAAEESLRYQSTPTRRRKQVRALWKTKTMTR